MKLTNLQPLEKVKKYYQEKLNHTFLQRTNESQTTLELNAELELSYLDIKIPLVIKLIIAILIFIALMIITWFIIRDSHKQSLDWISQGIGIFVILITAVMFLVLTTPFWVRNHLKELVDQIVYLARLNVFSSRNEISEMIQHPDLFFKYEPLQVTNPSENKKKFEQECVVMTNTFLNLVDQSQNKVYNKERRILAYSYFSDSIECKAPTTDLKHFITSLVVHGSIATSSKDSKVVVQKNKLEGKIYSEKEYYEQTVGKKIEKDEVLFDSDIEYLKSKLDDFNKVIELFQNCINNVQSDIVKISSLVNTGKIE